MRMPLIALILLLAPVLGCERLDDRLKEEATIQGQASAEAQRRTSDERTLELEEELATVQRLYQGASGTFLGDYALSDEFIAHLTVRLIPTVLPYHGRRVRTEAEVIDDLNRLRFDIEVTQIVGDDLFRTTCVFEDTEADLVRGAILPASMGCPYRFALWLGSDSVPRKEPRTVGVQEIRQKSPGVAHALLSGNLDMASHLVVQVQRMQRPGAPVEILLARQQNSP